MSGRWVCLPGTLCAGTVFDPMLDALGVTERVTVSIDRPTVEEMVPVLCDVVRPGDVVCGFSLGAIVAAHAVADLGDARAVVYLALNPERDDPAKAEKRLAFRDRVAGGDALGAIQKGWKRMSVEQGGAVQAEAEAMALALAPLITAQTSLVMSRGDARTILQDAPVPQVFVTGADDEVTPPSLLAGLPGAVKVLDGLGHFALLEDPTAMAAALQIGLREAGAKEDTR